MSVIVVMAKDLKINVKGVGEATPEVSGIDHLYERLDSGHRLIIIVYTVEVTYNFYKCLYG